MDPVYCIFYYHCAPRHPRTLSPIGVRTSSLHWRSCFTIMIIIIFLVARWGCSARACVVVHVDLMSRQPHIEVGPTIKEHKNKLYSLHLHKGIIVLLCCKCVNSGTSWIKQCFSIGGCHVVTHMYVFLNSLICCYCKPSSLFFYEIIFHVYLLIHVKKCLARR